MRRANEETVTIDGKEVTRFWLWKKGRRVYMDSEPGTSTEANKRRNNRWPKGKKRGPVDSGEVARAPA